MKWKKNKLLNRAACFINKKMEISVKKTIKIDSVKIKELILWHIKCKQVQNNELSGEIQKIEINVSHIDDFLKNGDKAIYAEIYIEK